MLNRYVLISLVIIGIAGASLISTKEVEAYTSGAPISRTGSPGDGASCTSCHSGVPTTLAGMITSNIPGTGYMPGNTYTITATITVASINKFGFEISPQSSTGVLKGTLVITNPTTTKLIGSGKWVTHQSAGTAGAGTKSWSFNWVAPALNQGPVTFYGAFNATNSNGASSGDQIFLSTLAVQQDASAGIFTPVAYEMDLNIYPNPVSDILNLGFGINEDGAYIIIMDITGKQIMQFERPELVKGENRLSFDVSELSPGTYFLSVQSGENRSMKKFIRI